MSKPQLGISLMHEPPFIQAVYPLFKAESIEVIEWSFDTILVESAKPDWMDPLLEEYGNAGRLIGHGVHFSTLDARWNQKQSDWIARLKSAFTKHKYKHLTEHFGFMSSPNAHRGCPLPLSMDERALAIGHDRLKRLQDAAKVPVGLENLALSFSVIDIQKQGEFLSKLVEPVNGFLILDLHNLYCQSHNFDIELMELVKMYPLQLVKEIHISGGSWADSIYGNQKIRRDTHDEAVPEILFDTLPEVLKLCPNLEFVILERLGNTFQSESDVLQHQSDFKGLKEIIDLTTFSVENKNWGNNVAPDNSPLNIDSLYNEQREMHQVLLSAKSLKEVKEKLTAHADMHHWDDEMINTAAILTKKWE